MLSQKKRLDRRRHFDYSKKNYSNPFFRKKKRKKVKRASLSWRIKLIIIEIIILIIGITLFIFFASYFNITNININGTEKISTQDIENLVWQQTETKYWHIIPQKNLWLFKKSKLISILNEKYFLENLTIEKKSPDSIIITLKEKIYSVIWLESDKYYYTDLEGNIISETNLEEIIDKDYPIVDYSGEDKITDNKIAIAKENIDFIIQLFNQFKNERYSFKIKQFIIDNEINTIKMTIDNGPEIYFNTIEDINKQITKLVILKNDKLKDDFNNKKYIDLRYGDRVYYR